MFSGGELWATDKPTLDLCDVCVQNYNTDRDQGVALSSILCWLGQGVRPSIRTSISFPIARSIFYFPIIRCLWPGFCLGQYLMFSCSLGITHHALVHCKLSVPQPRPECNDSDVLRQRLSCRIYLKPRSGVNHVKFRRCSSHNLTKSGK